MIDDFTPFTEYLWYDACEDSDCCKILQKYRYSELNL